MNEYLVELYSWLSSESGDDTFKERYTMEDFQNNMDDEAYALDIYEYLSKADETFQEREPIEIWSSKVKKKGNTIEQLTTGVEDVTASQPTDGESDSLEPNQNTPQINNSTSKSLQVLWSSIRTQVF